MLGVGTAISGKGSVDLQGGKKNGSDEAAVLKLAFAGC
jgi:hypothetical protein